MRARTRPIAVVVAVAVVSALLVAGGLRVWDHLHRSNLGDALDAVPEDAQRVAFTDWSRVREALDVAETSAPSAELVDRLTTRGYDTDLAAVSSIDEATAALQEHFGFSPTTMQWEAYAQSPAGAAMVARMPGGFDFEEVRDNLRDLGFTEPEADDGVWLGGTDLVAAIDPTISPELQYVAVLADRDLIVTSDTAEYAERAAAVAAGREPSLGGSGATDDLVAPAGDPAAAMVWARDFACSDLSMSTADPDAQEQAATLIEEAGKTTPVAGLVMAFDADRTFRVVLGFEDDRQAKDNLRARAALAVGEAVGRGGSFSDDLALTESRTDGATVVLGLEPREDEGFVLSALDSGPVIFATC